MLEINYVVLYCIVLYITALCFTRQVRDSNSVMCVSYVVYLQTDIRICSRVDIPSSEMCSRTVTLLRRLMLILTMSNAIMSGDNGDDMYYVFQLYFVFGRSTCAISTVRGNPMLYEAVLLGVVCVGAT